MNKLLKMNLQMFAADDGGGDGGKEPDPKEPENDKPNKSDKEETQLPTNQSELDAVINKSNQKAIENVQKDLYTKDQVQEIVQEEINKQKEYADLSEDERKQREFEDKRSEFEKQKAEFEYNKLVTDVKSDLVDKGLPASFAEVLAIKGDNEKSFEMVKAFETEWNQALAKQRKEDFKQSTPGVGGNGSKQSSYGARLGANKNKTSEKVFD